MSLSLKIIICCLKNINLNDKRLPIKRVESQTISHVDKSKANRKEIKKATTVLKTHQVITHQIVPIEIWSVQDINWLVCQFTTILVRFNQVIQVGVNHIVLVQNCIIHQSTINAIKNPY